MFSRVIFILSGILWAYISYQFYSIMEFSKVFTPKNIEKCEKLGIEMISEDLETYGNWVIGASGDISALFFKHLQASNAIPGFLFAANPVTMEYYRIKTYNLPDDLTFNPHGIFIYKNSTLYVISHSYSKGGERVFVFSLKENKKIEAVYVKSIYIDDQYGVHNALAVVADDYFYISEFSSMPDTLEGRSFSTTTDIKRNLISLFRQGQKLKGCKIVGDKAICEEKFSGYMPNGIAYIGETLFFADSLTKDIKVFTIQKNYDLSFITSVKLFHAPDNLRVYNGEIYTSGIHKSWDMIMFLHTSKRNKELHFIPGHVSKIYYNGTEWVSSIVISEDILSFPTTCTISQNKIVIPSLAENYLLVCPLTS